MAQHDIVILGGGLVGAALARSLALHNISCCVLDKQSANSLYSPELDNRGIALSYSSKQILEQLQLWHTLAPFTHCIQTVHVSEQGAFGFTKLHASTLSVPALGYVVSASDLGRTLVHDLQGNALINVLRPVDVQKLIYDAQQQQWQIELNSQVITAKLIVAADGTHSILRNVINVPVTTKDYQQAAIVCNISTQCATTATAFERFTERGVLALLPFGSKQLKCVWTAANAQVNKLQGLTDAEFLTLVQQTIGARVGKLLQVSTRKIFPIRHLAVHQLHAPGVVFIGNAANTLHPVAAQGLNLGLRDVQALSNILNTAYTNGRAINDPLMLQQYAQLRSSDHSGTQRFTNSIVEVFANNFRIIKGARKLGLLVAQFMPTMRERIITQGLGSWR